MSAKFGAVQGTAIAAAVLCIAAAAAFVYSENSRVAAAQGIHTAHQAVQELSQAGHALQFGRQDFSSLAGDWETARQSAAAAMKQASSHLSNPAASSYREELQEAVRLWGRAELQLSRLRSELSRTPEELPAGLLHTAARLDTLSPAARGYFSRIQAAAEAAAGAPDPAPPLQTAYRTAAAALQPKYSWQGSLAQWGWLVPGIAVSVLYLLAALWFTRSLQRRIAMLMDDLDSRADLRNHITLPPESGDELDALITRIRSAIRSRQERLHDTCTAAQQTAHFHEQLQRGIRTTQQTATSMETIGTAVRGRLTSFEQLLNNTRETLEVLQLKTRRLKQQGENQSVQVTETSSSIEQIDASIRSISQRAGERRSQALQLRDRTREDEDAIRGTRRNIAAIAEQMHSVSEIVATINAISEQTSQLSLNAFVESAHGSESNKGFEVVAAEIRQLSESTAENADNIRSLLHRIDDRVREALFFSEKTEHTFLSSMEVIQDFAESMQQISAHMGTTSELSQQVVRESQVFSERAELIQNLSSQAHQAADEGAAQLAATHTAAGNISTSLEAIEQQQDQFSEFLAAAKQLVQQSSPLIRKMGRIAEAASETGDT